MNECAMWKRSDIFVSLRSWRNVPSRLAEIITIIVVFRSNVKDFQAVVYGKGKHQKKIRDHDKFGKYLYLSSALDRCPRPKWGITRQCRPIVSPTINQFHFHWPRSDYFRLINNKYQCGDFTKSRRSKNHLWTNVTYLFRNYSSSSQQPRAASLFILFNWK